MQKEVLRVETAKNKNGQPYQRAVFTDNKNQPLFGDLAKKITGPGLYEFTYDQSVTPWKLLDASPMVVEPSINGNGSYPAARIKTSDMVSCAALNASSTVIVAKMQQPDFTMEKALHYIPKLVRSFKDGLQDEPVVPEETLAQ